jgi:hypothetical protein
MKQEGNIDSKSVPVGSPISQILHTFYFLVSLLTSLDVDM